MSWDVALVRVFRSADDLSARSKEVQELLGTHDEVIAALRTALPEIDLSDPAWGVLDGEDFSIEFDIGERKRPVESIVLHVRGSERALHPIRRLCVSTGWHPIDLSCNRLIDFDRTPSGLEEWQRHLNPIAGEWPPRG